MMQTEQVQRELLNARKRASRAEREWLERERARRSGGCHGYRAAGLGGAGIAIGIGIGAGSGAGSTPSGGSSGGPTDPLTIVTSVSCLAFFSADLGRTASGGAVSAWADQSGAGLSATQATGSAQPTENATGLNTHYTLRFTKANVQRLVIGTLNLAAPGTTPSFFWGVVKPVTVTTSDTIFAGGGSTFTRLFESTGLVRASNGVSGGTLTFTAGTWYRYELLFNNSAANDYLKVGSSTTGTGTALGNNDPAAGAITIGAQQSAGTNPGDFELACWGVWNGKPSGAELISLNSWVTGYYGAVVNV
jgi:hypothetical protein